jgi:hypothetical protein
LFAGLLCLIGPLLFGHDAHWAPWIWLVMAAGVAIVAAFPRLDDVHAAWLAHSAAAGWRHRLVTQLRAGAASRHAGQVVGLAVLALTVATAEAPAAPLLALVLAIFGYGQGLVMAPLSSTVLSTVKPASAGSGGGECTARRRKSPTPPAVAAIGAVFFAIEGAGSARLALFGAAALFALSIAACAAFLSWMRRAIA